VKLDTGVPHVLKDSKTKLVSFLEGHTNPKVLIFWIAFKNFASKLSW